jgi:hypothetical protein
MRAQASEAFPVLDGAAVVALGLGLVTEEQRPGGGVGRDHTFEAVGEAVIAVLDFDVFRGALELVMERDKGGFVLVVLEGVVEGDGSQAGFEAGEAEEGVLGERDAFDGEEFLGVGGLIDGDQVGAEPVDRGAVFDGDDGVIGAGESMFAGVLGGAGFALKRAGAGGAGGVGAIGGELFFGWHRLRGSTGSDAGWRSGEG